MASSARVKRSGLLVLAAATAAVATHVWLLHAWLMKRPLAWDAALAAAAIAWSMAGTPVLRTLGGASGDEPKYIRYCENLYQGLGFDVSHIKPMGQLPPDFRPRLLHNLALFGETIPGELQNLVSDAALFVRHPFHQFNRARHAGAGFIAGKNGGMYQLHNPGVSFVMLPAY